MALSLLCGFRLFNFLDRINKIFRIILFVNFQMKLTKPNQPAAEKNKLKSLVNCLGLYLENMPLKATYKVYFR